MRVDIVPIEDITPAEAAQWKSWAAPGGRLVSPYLTPDFAAAVARHRRDVRVAVIEAYGETVGFFAHHAPNGGVARPVGAPMSDYQGAVMKPGFDIGPDQLARAAGASALVFDTWHSTDPLSARFARGSEGSVIADLAEGSEAYFAARRTAFKDHFRKAARRARAAERDLGPVRVELGDASGDAFAQLAAWKERQYRETGKLNVFGIDWVGRLLSDLRQRDSAGFGGLTASLWFGERLAAVEFGLVAGDVYHSWFPAYDPELAKYSPGLQLLHGLFEQAPSRGIHRVDLGCGEHHYKKYYASEIVPLAHGRALAPGMAALGIRSWELAERAASIMPERLANLPVRLRRRWSQVSAFQPSLAPRLASFAGSLSL